MSMADYTEDETLDHWLRAETAPLPASVFTGIFTTAPTDAGGGTEVSGNAYAREEAGGGSGQSFAASSGGSSSNVELWQFPLSTPGGWGTCVATGIFDALTVGNLLFWGNLQTNRVVALNDTPEYPIGTLTVTLD